MKTNLPHRRKLLWAGVLATSLGAAVGRAQTAPVKELEIGDLAFATEDQPDHGGLNV